MPLKNADEYFLQDTRTYIQIQGAQMLKLQHCFFYIYMYTLQFISLTRVQGSLICNAYVCYIKGFWMENRQKRFASAGITNDSLFSPLEKMSIFFVSEL